MLLKHISLIRPMAVSCTDVTFGEELNEQSRHTNTITVINALQLYMKGL